MDPFRGIRVEVVSGGSALELYDDPEVDQITVGEKSYARTRYVEAVTGAKFAIRVVVSKLFDLSSLGPDDAIRVFVVLDGLEPEYYNHFTRQSMEQRLMGNEEASFDVGRITRYCKASERWTVGDPVFSAVTAGNSDDTHTTPNQIIKLGSIVAKITRVRRMRRLTPNSVWISKDKPITAISEKSIKGKAITNIVKLQNVSTSVAPNADYDNFPVAGDAGKELHFDFRYRSRQNLQSLGLIARTPTPEPDLREENRSLRERLALLERSSTANIKGESARTATPGIKRERKRERESDEGNHDRKRRGNNTTPEIVDLTEE